MMCIHIHFQKKKYFRKKTAEITRFDGRLVPIADVTPLKNIAKTKTFLWKL